MALIYVWLRLSTMKQLDWHRGSSYQSKDIAHAQKTIAQRMADKVSTQRTSGPQAKLGRKDLPQPCVLTSCVEIGWNIHGLGLWNADAQLDLDCAATAGAHDPGKAVPPSAVSLDRRCCMPAM